MSERDRQLQVFEQQRPMLRSLAYRMLGSTGEADDAVQDAWLRLDRSGARPENLAAWLRTVVARVCLDMLRMRAARREDAYNASFDRFENASEPAPDDDVLLADAVSGALLVVLDRLTAAERIAFVLHDMFAVPFDEIAPLVKRTPVAAKKLASRARGRVRGASAHPPAELARHRTIVAKFITAARTADLDSVLEVLAPDVVRRVDRTVLPPGVAAELRGARAVAEGTVALRRRSQLAELALVNGSAGILVAPHGRLLLAITFVIQNDVIAEYDVIADPSRLRRLDVAVLGEP